MAAKDAGAIQFESPVSLVGSTMLLRLPAEASAALPSRGQVAVVGVLNGHELRTVVEPDGHRGHWIRVEPAMQETAGLREGSAATVTLEVAPEWPEPQVPADLAAALAAGPSAVRDVWLDITPMARWEWVRWVDATANPKTRARRVEVSISKLDHGKRRPCCFDLSSCTDPAVAKSGKLVGG